MKMDYFLYRFHHYWLFYDPDVYTVIEAFLFLQQAYMMTRIKIYSAREVSPYLLRIFYCVGKFAVVTVSKKWILSSISYKCQRILVLF